MTGPHRGQVFGCVLAGGRSRRMGGTDKAVLDIGGQSLAVEVCARLAGQVSGVALNSNAGPAAWGQLGFPVIADPVSGFPGPLAGILAAMQHARSIDGITHVATAAVDTPFFPTDLVHRLAVSAVSPETIVLAASAGRVHPVFGLWPVALCRVLEQWLGSAENYAVRRFTEDSGARIVDFPFEAERDPFFNINTPEDLAEARAMSLGTR